MMAIDEIEKDDQVEEVESTSRRLRAWREPGNLVIAVLVAVMLALLGTSAYLWQDRRTDLDQGVVEVAREHAELFFSLDHRDPDRSIDKMLALSTADFKKSYAARRDQVVAQLKEKEVVATANVPEDGAAIEFLDDTHAQVLVALNVTTASRSQGSEDQRYRARIELARVDGSWLVSAINQVG
ncbi:MULTISPECIES: hypothetical protein [unclassified Nocardioides]|uniref:hypothetical protein n=1 Tax=unclassified Nocardioides TaxID=2615069 RepID=UPI0006FC0052|nr:MULTISPECIES: hypothetical protein [unclassified Nocardioides]KRA28025.1 hypothetical protein ASD81_22900 [Nocardioides sp. Root614]KRA86000.1 hypothetical protein ASD84_23140 [Nocardioides sp. Root682]